VIPGAPVSLLEVDPDLGQGLEPREFEQAMRDLRVATAHLGVEDLESDAGTHQDGHGLGLGLLLIEGIILRDVSLGRRSTTELLAATDLIRPWQDDTAIDALPFVISATILEDAVAAILDRRFIVAAARWPAVLEALSARTLRRSRWLSARLVVNQLARLEDRIVIALWGLAERFGRVTPDGVVLPLELTHSTLARLVSARRPSVTTALGVLGREGLVVRTDQGWLLQRDPTSVFEWLNDRITAV
jgi:CRP/FNR family cyclic AMP-dependent transcriptional regulator